MEDNCRYCGEHYLSYSEHYKKCPETKCVWCGSIGIKGKTPGHHDSSNCEMKAFWNEVFNSPVEGE